MVGCVGWYWWSPYLISCPILVHAVNFSTCSCKRIFWWLPQQHKHVWPFWVCSYAVPTHYEYFIIIDTSTVISMPLYLSVMAIRLRTPSRSVLFSIAYMCMTTCEAVTQAGYVCVRAPSSERDPGLVKERPPPPFHCLFVNKGAPVTLLMRGTL